jgi:hypothetical protein
MGFRFQKRLKVLPGVTLNLSKKGVSTSLGARGARVTYGHGQKRTTVGLPGTGISHTQIQSTKTSATQASEEKNTDSDDTKNLVVGIAFVVGLFGIAGLISKCTG